MLENLIKFGQVRDLDTDLGDGVDVGVTYEVSEPGVISVDAAGVITVLADVASQKTVYVIAKDVNGDPRATYEITVVPQTKDLSAVLGPDGLRKKVKAVIKASVSESAADPAGVDSISIWQSGVGAEAQAAFSFNVTKAWAGQLFAYLVNATGLSVSNLMLIPLNGVVEAKGPHYFSELGAQPAGDYRVRLTADAHGAVPEHSPVLSWAGVPVVAGPTAPAVALNGPSTWSAASTAWVTPIRVTGSFQDGDVVHLTHGADLPITNRTVMAAEVSGGYADFNFNVPASTTMDVYAHIVRGATVGPKSAALTVTSEANPESGSSLVASTDGASVPPDWTYGGLGSLATDGAKIYPSDFGGPIGYGGPSMDKVFSAVADFDLEMAVEWNIPYGAYHILSTALRDAGNTEVAKIYLVSDSNNQPGLVFYAHGFPIASVSANNYTGTLRIKRVGTTVYALQDGAVIGALKLDTAPAITRITTDFQQYSSNGGGTLKLDDLKLYSGSSPSAFPDALPEGWSFVDPAEDGILTTSGGKTEVLNFGAASGGWYGPAIKKPVSVAGDFVMTANIEWDAKLGINHSLLGRFKVAVLDVGGRNVGEFVFMDSQGGSASNDLFVYYNSGSSAYSEALAGAFAGEIRIERAGSALKFYKGGTLLVEQAGAYTEDIAEVRVTFEKIDGFNPTIMKMVGDIVVEASAQAAPDAPTFTVTNEFAPTWDSANGRWRWSAQITGSFELGDALRLYKDGVLLGSDRVLTQAQVDNDLYPASLSLYPNTSATYAYRLVRGGVESSDSNVHTLTAPAAPGAQPGSFSNVSAAPYADNTGVTFTFDYANLNAEYGVSVNILDSTNAYVTNGSINTGASAGSGTSLSVNHGFAPGTYSYQLQAQGADGNSVTYDGQFTINAVATPHFVNGVMDSYLAIDYVDRGNYAAGAEVPVRISTPDAGMTYKIEMGDFMNMMGPYISEMWSTGVWADGTQKNLLLNGGVFRFTPKGSPDLMMGPIDDALNVGNA